MGFMDWFTMKTKEQQDAETEHYRQWAFPYGQAQRQMVEERLRELFPKEKKNMTMLNYLIAKESYYGTPTVDLQPVSQEKRNSRIRRAKATLKKTLSRSQYSQIPLYLALILADETAGPELQYPDCETLRQESRELEQIK